MTQEALKKMYQLLLTEPHAPNVCAQLERIAREALAEHAMRETQRLGQEIEQEPPLSVKQAYAMAQVCLDLHEAIGCKWGDNVYFAIDQLKAVAQPPQRTWVGLEKKDMPDGADPLFDDPKFIAGMVYAANKLMEKNT